MAVFLNPKEGQEEWLSNNARMVDEVEALGFTDYATSALLCRVDTGTAYLLGVAYDAMEKAAYAYREIYWVRHWYICNRKIAEDCYGNPWETLNEKK